MPTIGVITEQGDLGLGFNQLNNKDQKAYDEATNPNKESSNTQVINESK